MRYENHPESVYCVAGRGEAVTAGDDRGRPAEPGTARILGGHDGQASKAFGETAMPHVVNASLNGREVHGDSGAHPVEMEGVE